MSEEERVSRAMDRAGGDPGIYRKFHVRRVDGSSAPGGKHEGCEYFVLDWQHDPYAVPAAVAYAEACRAKFPALADDLLAHVQVPIEPDPRDARIAELEAERDALREPVEPTTADDPSKDAIVMAHTLTAAVLGYNELAKLTDVLGEKVYWRLLRQKSADLLNESGGGSVEFVLPQVILTLSHRPYRVEFTAQDIERMRETVAAYDAGYAKNERKGG